ncbi:hypothetical protein [Vibrio pelagius]|nr:hypothetical protein [Vibrio pelagius]
MDGNREPLVVAVKEKGRGSLQATTLVYLHELAKLDNELAK